MQGGKGCQLGLRIASKEGTQGRETRKEETSHVIVWAVPGKWSSPDHPIHTPYWRQRTRSSRAMFRWQVPLPYVVLYYCRCCAFFFHPTSSTFSLMRLPIVPPSVLTRLLSRLKGWVPGPSLLFDGQCWATTKVLQVPSR